MTSFVKMCNDVFGLARKGIDLNKIGTEVPSIIDIEGLIKYTPRITLYRKTWTTSLLTSEQQTTISRSVREYTLEMETPDTLIFIHAGERLFIPKGGKHKNIELLEYLTLEKLKKTLPSQTNLHLRLLYNVPIALLDINTLEVLHETTVQDITQKYDFPHTFLLQILHANFISQKKNVHQKYRIWYKYIPILIFPYWELTIKNIARHMIKDVRKVNTAFGVFENRSVFINYVSAKYGKKVRRKYTYIDETI